MRAPLANVGKELREKSGAHCIWAFIVPVNRFARLIRKSGPPGNTRLKFTRKIDIFLRNQGFLNLPERRVAFAFCYRERQRENKVKIVATMSFRTFISELLNHRAARSQQVRITPNKFRPFKTLDDLSASLWIIIHRPDYGGKAGGHGMLFARRRRRKMDRICFPYHLGCEKPFDHNSVYSIHRS